MYVFFKTWFTIKADRRAVTALECGLIAAVIAGIAVVGISAIENSLDSQIIVLATKV